MERKIYTKEMKEAILKEANEVGNVAQVARCHGVSPKNIYNWSRQAKHKNWQATPSYAKNTHAYTPNAQEFKTLENENQKLKTLPYFILPLLSSSKIPILLLYSFYVKFIDNFHYNINLRIISL